jgi:hypothetical protein
VLAGWLLLLLVVLLVPLLLLLLVRSQQQLLVSRAATPRACAAAASSPQQVRQRAHLAKPSLGQVLIGQIFVSVCSTRLVAAELLQAAAAAVQSGRRLIRRRLASPDQVDCYGELPQGCGCYVKRSVGYSQVLAVGTQGTVEDGGLVVAQRGHHHCRGIEGGSKQGQGRAGAMREEGRKRTE